MISVKKAPKNINFNTKKFLAIALKYLFFVIALLVVIMPLLPIIIGSFKSNTEFYNSDVLQMPSKWLFSNYAIAFKEGKMLTAFGNTLLIMCISLVISMLIGAMTSYVLHRFAFKGKFIITALFLGAALLPSITNNIALFQLLVKFKVFNTRMAGILLFSGTDIISIYIFLQFMNNISKSLDESAMIDGASYFRIFFIIIFPLLLPAAATVVIIRGVAIYNDFTTPFLFMPKSGLEMISTSLYNFTGPFGAKWEIICAGVVLITLPILVIFLSMQKWIYGGLVMGSVKE